jgi:DNA mismatch endonuclease, patch repair protein
MAAVGTVSTGPELVVRRLVHGMGIRYGLHRKDLPGTPDMVFSSRKKVIFVHGCFWHRHFGCSKATNPTARAHFWADKFEKNVERDRRVQQALKRSGWKTLVVWQCELRNPKSLQTKLARFLKR